MRRLVGFAFAAGVALAVVTVPFGRPPRQPTPTIVVRVPDVPPPDIPKRAILTADLANPQAASGIAPPASEVAPAPDTVALPPPSLDVPAVRDAVAAYRRGDLAAGDAIRAGLTETATGALLDWAAIRLAGSRIDDGRVAAFMAAYPAWPGMAWLKRRAEELFLAERRPSGAVRAFFGGNRPLTVGGRAALASALRADGFAREASAQARDVWRNDTIGRDLETRLLAEFGGTLTLADHRFRMERLMFRETWDAASRAAGYAGKGYDTLVKARIAVDASSREAGKLLDAVPAALRTEPSYLFSRAQFLRRAEKAEEAAKLIALVPADPSTQVDGDEWWVERRLVARKLLDGGDALAAYATLATNVALSAEKRIEAEFHAGWVALRFLDDPPTAAGHFARAAEIAATPISLSRAAYWQGRAAEAAGSAAEARSFYERAASRDITYYGQLAAEKLGRTATALRPATDPGHPARIKAQDALSTRAFGLLYDAGLRDLALSLMTEFARQGSDVAELDAVANVALLNRDARSLLALGKGATQRGLPLEERAFPTIGIPSFEPVGPRVEPAMVHAIARQESAFDPAAGSSAGARGLMQLMPATAQATARKFGVEFDVSRLLDAPYNTKLGAAHLGELMESWRGSHILVFAAYNAGPGNVRKWIEAYGDPRRPEVDPVDWVERIPFSETRNYVQRVSENLNVYRRRLDERSARAADRDATGSVAIR